MGKVGPKRVPRKESVQMRNGAAVGVGAHQTTVYVTSDVNESKPSADGTVAGISQLAEEPISSEVMTPEEIKSFAIDALREHGLSRQGWVFSWSNSKTKFGLCHFGHRSIMVSSFLAAASSSEEVRDTVLHEVAHALAGPQAGHGPKWKRIAEELGARPEAKASESRMNAIPSKWVGTCPKCGDVVRRHRLTQSARKSACFDCCQKYNNGKFTDEYSFIWEDTNR
jgi:SprT protein